MLEVIHFVFQLFCIFVHTDAAGYHGGVHIWAQQAALLQWKSSLQASSVLGSWRLGTSPCSSNWTGVTCAVVHRGHRAPRVVTSISLSNAGIDGYLGELNFSALPFLTHMDLSYNSLHGEIPVAIATLRVLSYLDLRGNFLHGNIPFEIGNMVHLSKLGLSSNNLTGCIPASIRNLTTLTDLDFQNNMLSGSIPEELSMLKNLEGLGLGPNMLSGPIPKSLGNLTKLNILLLYSNQLSGPIPTSLCNLMNLLDLGIAKNQLSGGIPICLANLTKLYTVELHDNLFTGSIPPNIGLLPNLGKLVLYECQLTGPIPPSLGNLTRLNYLDLSQNQFVGSIPNEIGSLVDVSTLSLSINQISGSIPTTFANLTSIENLGLFSNKLSGLVPQGFGNLTHLAWLELGNNSLSGELPSDICKGGKLQALHAANNSFIGQIPSSLKTCKSLTSLDLNSNQLTWDISDFGTYPHLQFAKLSTNNFHGRLSEIWASSTNLTFFDLSENMINGSLPSELSRLQKLEILILHTNNLSGKIPPELSNLTNLYQLNLSQNQFSGQIPIEFGQMRNLQYLDISMNKLSGSIPQELGNCTELRSLMIRQNDLSGDFPVTIGNLENLQIVLDVSDNKLQGELPAQLGNLKMLIFFNLSHNQFSGIIPSSFAGMVSLSTLDVSYNNLEGPLPMGKLFSNASLGWFIHNKGLCGNLSGLPTCYSTTAPEHHSRRIHIFEFAISTPLCIVTIMATFGVAMIIHKKKKPQETTTTERRDVLSVWNFDGKLAFEDIIRATNNFSDRYIIGSGGCGTVYKAELQDGRLVAVKKLHETGEDMSDGKKFISEIGVLTKIRHRCIVKMYGFCSHPRFKFLVSEYIDRGDLHAALENEELAKELDWQKRIAIARDVAQAVYYLHHECNPPIIHRDITSKNILLDTGFKAYVSDFGTARIIKPDSSNWSELAGTYGYIAPELSYTSVVTTKCDIYSFGVVTLEMVMGRYPRELQALASLGQANKLAMNFLDQRPLSPTRVEKEEIALLVEVAFACLPTSPQSRPTMQNIYLKLSSNKPSAAAAAVPSHAPPLEEITDGEM